MVHEDVAEETLHVGPEIWEQILSVVVTHGGQMRPMWP
jgi:hypothetical protein